jgi:hypothetical protein
VRNCQSTFCDIDARQWKIDLAQNVRAMRCAESALRFLTDFLGRTICFSALGLTAFWRVAIYGVRRSRRFQKGKEKGPGVQTEALISSFITPRMGRSIIKTAFV